MDDAQNALDSAQKEVDRLQDELESVCTIKNCGTGRYNSNIIITYPIAFFPWLMSAFLVLKVLPAVVVYLDIAFVSGQCLVLAVILHLI